MLIRDLADPMHAELRRRAESEGMSMQAYVTRLLERHVERPTVTEWLQRLEEIEPVTGVSGVEAVESARRDLP